MVNLIIVSYITVFVAELIGDKLLYTVGVLGTRYRTLPVMSGVGFALLGKMLAAVLLGNFVSQLPARLLGILSATSFITMAILLWRKDSDLGRAQERQPRHWSSPIGLAFAVVFFSEWGDPSQIAAATLVTRYHAPFIVCVGATLAMMTKVALAITFGASLRERMPQVVSRYCGVCVLVTLGMISIVRLPR
jgi:Ca2+/H+ antiporter, TMEM165/GDT1 family